MIIKGLENDPLRTDVCIVGAGPVGLALAFKCARAGLSVRILEAGNLEDEAAADETFGTLNFSNQHHADASLTVRRGIGGTSSLWGGRCVALDDVDFEKRPFVPFSGWPVSHSAIAGYYREAFAFLGCGRGEVPSAFADRPEDEISTGSLEYWSAHPDLRGVYGDALQASRAVLVNTDCTVTGVRLCAAGETVTGLTVKAGGRVADVTSSAYVLAGGGLENTRLLLATQRLWPRKFGGPDGALGRFYAGHLTGYIAAIRFAQHGAAKAFWYSKNRDGSYVRRRLALTPPAQATHEVFNTAFWLESLSVADPAHGSGALSLVYVALALTGLFPRVGRGLAPLSDAPRGDVYGAHVANIRNDPRLLAGVIDVLPQLMLQPFRKRNFAVINPAGLFLLRYHAEQAPNPESRVRLSAEQDGRLLPRLDVDFRFLREDVASVVKSHAVLDRGLQASGIGQLEYLQTPDRRDEHVLDQALDGYHQLGVTRMSASGRDGVVDPDCRVHDVSNLFVAGSSVFPTAGQANPTLPAVALSLRLGDHLQRFCR